jgi:hypothetical protein
MGNNCGRNDLGDQKALNMCKNGSASDIKFSKVKPFNYACNSLPQPLSDIAGPNERTFKGERLDEKEANQLCRLLRSDFEFQRGR